MTDQNNSNPRRTFLLQAAGLTAAGSLLKAASPADAAAATAPVPAAAPDAASVPYQSLSPDEATFIEALVNVMCPADEYSPNGADCGIAAYIDRQLAGPYGKGDGRYLQGPFRSGVVGKNFCYQTSSGVDVFFRNRWINPFLAAGSTAMVIDEFNNDNFDHSVLPFLGGASIDVLVTNGRPIRARRTPPGTPGWGSAWKKATADWYSHSFTVGAQGSCYPHRENFLDLDPDYTDIYGQRLLRMTFDFRENELRMSEWVTQKVGEICRAMAPHLLGAVEGLRGQFDTRQYQTTHVTGGTIMGADPHSSVVSPHLQHWDAENLFVVGASVYPHNSGYNPTGPLAALALRLGDDLARYIERPRML